MKVTDIDTTTLTFEATYEYIATGHFTEDGDELVERAFFVVATTPDGTRFKRCVGYWGWENNIAGAEPFVYRAAFAPEGRRLEGVGEATLADAATEITNRLEASPTRRLNPDAWTFAGAVYGSAAYQALNIEEDTIALEREAESWR